MRAVFHQAPGEHPRAVKVTDSVCDLDELFGLVRIVEHKLAAGYATLDVVHGS